MLYSWSSAWEYVLLSGSLVVPSAVVVVVSGSVSVFCATEDVSVVPPSPGCPEQPVKKRESKRQREKARQKSQRRDRAVRFRLRMVCFMWLLLSLVVVR